MFNFSDPPDAFCDVIFVHGLDGDLQKAWCPTSSALSDSWPMWVADALSDAAVRTVGYDAAASDWFGHAMPLVDRATNILTLFEIHNIGARPVAFICHSMGGLLVKQILRHAVSYGQARWQALARNTKLIVFVSTPHHGSKLADYLDTLRLLLRPSASTRDLQYQAPALEDLNDWFGVFVRDSGLAVVSFYETKKTKVSIVVDKLSANAGLPGVITRGIDADHFDICKPKTRDDVVAGFTLLSLNEFIAKLRPAIPLVTADLSPSLTYRTAVDVDEDCFDQLLAAPPPYDIAYHNDVAAVLSLLDSYDRDPRPFLDKVPSMRTRDMKKREENAAWYHAQIHELNVLIERLVTENKNDLAAFVSRLKADGVQADLARRALKAFGTFAVLRLIQHLKRFYDVENDQPVLFFESYVFNQDPCYCYLDWAPRQSPTGKRLFGYYYFVGARVGPSESHYEYVMLPLDLGRRLFKNDVRGDAETFYTWILPQLYIVGCHQDIDSFPANDWEIILLQGVGDREWQASWSEDPWKGFSG